MINLYAFDLAKDYKEQGMPAYVNLQGREFNQEANGYTATKHQHEVGASYFDEVLMTVTEGGSSTSAMQGSTESEQFE